MAQNGDRAPLPANGPETGGEFDIDRLSRLAIDQAILDGMVDDQERRVHVSELAIVAFSGNSAPEPVFEEFQGALAGDERYVDMERNRYRYTPVVGEDTEAMPRPIAILKGTALVGKQEREAVWERMESHLGVVYEAARTRGTTRFSVDEMKASLKETGAELTSDELRALLHYLKKDHRQWLTKDGLLILGADGDGAANLPAKSADVENFGPLIAETVSQLRAATGSDVFTPQTLIRVLRKSMGVYLERYEANELVRQLAAQPNISPYGANRFRITGELEIPDSAAA